MYIAFVITLVLTASIPAALGEQCHTTSDCLNTLCVPGGARVACSWNTCICEAISSGTNTNLRCNDQSTCTALGQCRHHDETYHCLDGDCVCLKKDVFPHGHH